MVNDWIRAFAAAVFPADVRRWLRAYQCRHRLQGIRTGSVEFGMLRRTRPVSRVFGIDRGLPISRYYIEKFLADFASDIRGRVLEIGDDSYTQRFGMDRVTQSDVLHVVAGNPKATIVADLSRADQIPRDTFDCIICTQSLEMIYDVGEAVRHIHRILKPAGVLLVTAHGISKIGRREGIDDWGEYWHLTTHSIKRMLEEVFSPTNLTVRSYGNVLAAIAFLHGLATEELSADELNDHDPDYELLVAARAIKSDCE